MKYSTGRGKAWTWGAGASEAAVVGEWEALVKQLPADLETSAVALGALVRRRKVKAAQALLRMVLLYAACDWSLRTVAMWCNLLGIGKVSDVTILNRLRQSCEWLGYLVGQMLERRMCAGGQSGGQSGLPVRAGVRVRLQDASVITAPGARGTTWRIHLSFDLGRLCILGVQVTDAKGGESLARFPLQPGEIVIADRGYNAVSSLMAVVAADSAGGATSGATGGDFIVRMQWCGVPVYDGQGQRFDTVAWLRQCFPTPYTQPHVSPPQEIELTLVAPGRTLRVRLIACALPPDAAARARKRGLTRARKSGYTASPNGLFAVGFFFVLTTLPAYSWPAQQVLDFYRCRWQVELHFKRLKSILHLDHLRAFDPRLVQTYLLAKLLLALLLDRLVQPVHNQFPTWFEDDQRPVSHWRLTTLLYTYLHASIRGSVPWHQMLAALPALRPYLCNSPRLRTDQAVLAAKLIHMLNYPRLS